MDYGRLRTAALSHGEDEEAVTVDTRALIDKVLARYSGEWTTLRELIQNAADAQATTVNIKWETLPSVQVPLPSMAEKSDILKHVLQYHTLRRLVVSNNGQSFTKTDWGRLKRIAEGNPDETKIGAFGVGFYSVFADCEEPFVSSGDEAMAFYWKGNALFTRKLRLSDDQRSNETAFVLDYRNSTTPLPNLLSVCQFLATSLTFVALQHIEFWIDDYRVLSLHKKMSPSVEVALSRDVETTTKERLMTVNKVESASTQIDASFMSAIGWKPQVAASKSGETFSSSSSDVPSLRSFFTRLTSTPSAFKSKAAKEDKVIQDTISEDITAPSSSSIFLRVTTAAIKPSVSANFAAELERATKKPPPKMAKLAILTSSYDETKASDSSKTGGAIAKATDVFASVLPSKKPGGRIFIGFPTTQTTGAGMHISAPSVIPTVEREAIDLNARWVRTWNTEMLRAAGIMTRLAFVSEMEELQLKLQRAVKSVGAPIGAKETATFMEDATHILKSFSFGDSTPSGLVSGIIEEAFWTCYKQAAIEIYSTRGVYSTFHVRIGSDDLSKFVGGIPVVPPELLEIGFVKKVIDFDLIQDISIEDVRQELSKYPMNKDQTMAFLGWVCKKAAVPGGIDPTSRDRLLEAAIITTSEAGSEQGGIIPLSTIRHYLVANKIPPGLPVPPTTIPFEFTSQLSTNSMQSLGWEPLEVLPWLRFILETGNSRPEDQNMTKSAKFSVQILTVLSKGWDNISQAAKPTIVDLLKSHTVIPTRLGMRKPTESFFQSVKLFDDLPIIECSSLKEKFLVAIGVRKTVDLETIFKRLLTPAADGTAKPKWSHVELIKYLASVRNDIPAEDMKRLKESRICPAERMPVSQGSTHGGGRVYKVSELFEPKAALRVLDIKLLQWPTTNGGFSLASSEGRFLEDLGLRHHPSVPELVEMMASPNSKLRIDAMDYFVAYHVSNAYYNFNLQDTDRAFLPLERDWKQLVTPRACYTNKAASLLGFDILKGDLHIHASKFGVQADPPMMQCVKRFLNTPPRDRQAAIPLFEYFASRAGEMESNAVNALRSAPIVPVTRRQDRGADEKGTKTTFFVSPSTCFLGSSSTYADIFDYVDFGRHANVFLQVCGAKQEPTPLEIAELAVNEPQRLLDTFQGIGKYLHLLRSLAAEAGTLKRDKELWKKMRTAPFLVAYKDMSHKEGLGSEEEEEDTIKISKLVPANQIIVKDDVISFRLFKEQLLYAPEEDPLENFYLALGSQNLSSLITQELKPGSYSERQDSAARLRKHVLERSKLFISEYTKNTRDPFKHDVKWLEKNLTVRTVRTLILRRVLRGTEQSHTEERSAASQRGTDGYVLYVASKYTRPDMYQVAMAIGQLILVRPDQHAYTFFEPFLINDLLGLRSRGYNVDRILRAQENEARIAEEERRKALAAEQARIKERDEQFRRQGAEQLEAVSAAARQERTRTPPGRMPGGYESNSPSEDNVQPVNPNRRNRGFFSNLTKRFGLEEPSDEEQEQQLQKFMDANENPAPPGSPKETRPTKNGETSKVTNPAVVQQNLFNAINVTRPHGSNILESPPSMTTVKEQATYCDSTPAQNLIQIVESANGTRVFVERTSKTTPEAFLNANHTNINAFAELLRDVATIYSLKPSSLHIFYDAAGSTIAFNNSGAIFCNLRFFSQLHIPAALTDAESRAEATIWWWVVLAHELAHNIVGPHNADHSYYTESFIQTYFLKMMLHASHVAANKTPLGQQGRSKGAGDGR